MIELNISRLPIGIPSHLAQEAVCLAKRISSVILSPQKKKQALGFVIGFCLPSITVPLSHRVIKPLGFAMRTPSFSLSTARLCHPALLLAGFFVCIVAPVTEEVLFRDGVQPWLKEKIRPFFRKQGLSPATADRAARLTAIAGTSVIFGAMHFTNALFFCCHPWYLIPQVVHSAMIGIACGMAKEVSQDLDIAIGIHAGNNTRAFFSL